MKQNQAINKENESLFFSLKAESMYMFFVWFRRWLKDVNRHITEITQNNQ